MAVFFILLGITAGLLEGSALQGWKPELAGSVSAVVSAVVTLLMYLGEMRC